jgi:hypothetical protein
MIIVRGVELDNPLTDKTPSNAFNQGERGFVAAHGTHEDQLGPV